MIRAWWWRDKLCCLVTFNYDNQATGAACRTIVTIGDRYCVMVLRNEGDDETDARLMSNDGVMPDCNSDLLWWRRYWLHRAKLFKLVSQWTCGDHRVDADGGDDDLEKTCQYGCSSVKCWCSWKGIDGGEPTVMSNYRWCRRWCSVMVKAKRRRHYSELMKYDAGYHYCAIPWRLKTDGQHQAPCQYDALILWANWSTQPQVWWPVKRCGGDTCGKLTTSSDQAVLTWRKMAWWWRPTNDRATDC